MGRLDNIKRIIKEDFAPEYHDMIGRLAYILNSFMEQVEGEVNGNLDQDNLASDVVEYTVTVDSNGFPVGNNLVRSNVSRAKGTTVIKATNLTNTGVYPEGQPHISFTLDTNSFLIKVLHISNLQAGNKYQLVIKVE